MHRNRLTCAKTIHVISSGRTCDHNLYLNPRCLDNGKKPQSLDNGKRPQSLHAIHQIYIKKYAYHVISYITNRCSVLNTFCFVNSNM